MTISSTLTKLASVVLASSGITTSKTAIPATIHDSELPCAVVYPDRGELNEHAVGLYRHIQTYIVRVYVKPIAQGASIDEGYQACFAPYQALADTLIRNTSLDSTVDEVRQPIRTLGPRGDFVWADTTYHGFEFQLDITEKTT
jgi:hypothetical protein